MRASQITTTAAIFPVKKGNLLGPDVHHAVNGSFPKGTHDTNDQGFFLSKNQPIDLFLFPNNSMGVLPLTFIGAGPRCVVLFRPHLTRLDFNS